MTDPRCPECQGDMVLREGKFGSFWGCRNYPTCTGSMNIRKAAAEAKTDDGTKSARTKANASLIKFAATRGWTNLQSRRWLSETMGLNWGDAQPNLFTAQQCELMLEYLKLESNPSSESEMALAMRRANQAKTKNLRRG